MLLLMRFSLANTREQAVCYHSKVLILLGKTAVITFQCKILNKLYKQKIATYCTTVLSNIS